MLALIVSLALIAATWMIRLGSFAGGLRGWRITGMDGNTLGLTAVAIIAAIWYFGWHYGVTLILSILLHKYGHVAAYRGCAALLHKSDRIPSVNPVC